MKAFLLAMIVMVAIAGVAATVTGNLPLSSKETFTVQENVRLPGPAD